MALAGTGSLNTRRTGADIVFDVLHDEIMATALLPGTKLSEAEVANRMGVSRQPVREAFHRLSTLGLLLVQPQKATIVRKFSLARIEDARFVRLAIELEMGRRAIEAWSVDRAAAFESNMAGQELAVAENDYPRFHALDQEFHRLIADTAKALGVFEIMLRSKAMLDRICLLSLKQGDEMRVLVQDHRAIFNAIATGDRSGLEATLRTHLARIDGTIRIVSRENADYFEDL